MVLLVWTSSLRFCRHVADNASTPVCSQKKALSCVGGNALKQPPHHVCRHHVEARTERAPNALEPRQSEMNFRKQSRLVGPYAIQPRQSQVNFRSNQACLTHMKALLRFQAMSSRYAEVLCGRRPNLSGKNLPEPVTHCVSIVASGEGKNSANCK